MQLSDLSNVNINAIDLAIRMLKKEGNNVCVAIGPNNEDSGLRVKNEHSYNAISSKQVFLYSDFKNALVLESKGINNLNPKARDSALLTSDNIRLLGTDIDLYTYENGLKWMNGFLNPSLNIAFEYNKYLANITASQALGNNISEELSMPYLYANALMSKDYLIPTMNPIAVGILQALICELPKHLFIDCALPEHTHFTTMSMFNSAVANAVSSMGIDGTVQVATGSIPYIISGTFASSLGVVSSIASLGLTLPTGVSTGATAGAAAGVVQSSGMQSVNITSLASSAMSIGGSIGATLNSDSISKMIDEEMENKIKEALMKASDGLPRIGAKLLFKKPNQSYFSSISSKVKDKIKGMLSNAI